jgi:hypothetical protein
MGAQGMSPQEGEVFKPGIISEVLADDQSDSGVQWVGYQTGLSRKRATRPVALDPFTELTWADSSLTIR